MVLVQNHTKGPFDPKYVGDYHVVAIKGNQVEVKPSIGGPTEMKHIKHVKYIHPVDKYIKHIPNYSTFGRKTTLRINPKQIPDLHWQLEDSFHTTNIGQSTLQVCTPKRRYHSNGTNLHMDTTVINSNTSAITSIDVNIAK